MDSSESQKEGGRTENQDKVLGGGISLHWGRAGGGERGERRLRARMKRGERTRKRESKCLSDGRIYLCRAK